MEHTVNPFDVHVGRINELYEDIWRNVSGIDFDGKLSFRTTLVDSVVSMSNAEKNWTPLTEFISQHPEVEYNPNSTMSIRKGEELLRLDSWLLQYKLFASVDRQRCYTWDIGKVLTPDDPYYNLYLYLLINKSDAYQIGHLLEYQLSHSFGGKTELFYAVLDQIEKYYDNIGKPASVILNAIETWKAISRQDIVSTPKKGRKPRIDGGNRQKEIAITMKLVASCMNYNVADKKIAEAFSIMTSYSTSGLAKVLSALQTGNDTDFQFKQSHFDQVEKLLDAMQNQLIELRKKW